jgi:damage-control phosphatase, subfamily I
LNWKLFRYILIVFTMELLHHCYGCLRGLVEKSVALSHGNGDILSQTYALIDDLWHEGRTPPEVANKLQRFIREKTGAYDPYLPLKTREVEEARKAMDNLCEAFPKTLEGFLKLSALGNSMDFFCQKGYTIEGFDFSGDIDNIEKEIYTKGNTVLIFADNVGELFFDMGLIRYFENLGKNVFYAAKEHPIQNDLSMSDVDRFGFTKIFPNIISTGTDEVGIRREDLKGKTLELWESAGIVIAKGMGNYETISEFNKERPVIHIMKVKCPTVAHAVGRNVGQYIAIIGGGEYGNEKRLL